MIGTLRFVEKSVRCLHQCRNVTCLGEIYKGGLIGNAMTLRQLSKTHFLPEEVRDVIWGFGWHLNLGVITGFRCVVREGAEMEVHYLYSAFVKNLPHGIDHQHYMRVLGIPLCFDAIGKPKARVYPPLTTRLEGHTVVREVYGHDTSLGVETWGFFRDTDEYEGPECDSVSEYTNSDTSDD